MSTAQEEGNGQKGNTPNSSSAPSTLRSTDRDQLCLLQKRGEGLTRILNLKNAVITFSSTEICNPRPKRAPNPLYCPPSHSPRHAPLTRPSSDISFHF